MPLQATSGAASYDAFGGGAAAVPNYIEEVFQTWLYTGSTPNFSTNEINNGIDLLGKGGMVWIKGRDQAYDHNIFDTVRGTSVLSSNNTNAAVTYASYLNYKSNGFDIYNSAGFALNYYPYTYVSWTFREQPKFFDVVTYTGNGSAITVNHNLGSVPGCIIVKNLSAGDSWLVWHRSLSGTSPRLFLDETSAAATTNGILSSSVTSTSFTYPWSFSTGNGNGQQYVAYLFAHNAGGFGLTGNDNVISCGTFTVGGSGNATVNLGFEPQWVITKATDVSGNWRIADVMRGMTANGTDAVLSANLSDAEASANLQVAPTATGFQVSGGLPYTATYIYIAIRRGPMKVPTTGTSVLNLSARTGNANPNAGVSGGFTDLIITKDTGGSEQWAWTDRLRGPVRELGSSTATAETAYSNDVTSFARMDGVNLGNGSGGQVNSIGTPYINFLMRRAPGVFDEVCYTGTGTSGQTYSHNLGVVPEMMIVKSRSVGSSWYVYTPTTGNTNTLVLNSTAAVETRNVWGSTTPTASVFSVGSDGNGTNNSGATYVAYLFASLTGISKVGSYTGTGTTQTINCGFTSGARFVMIKRTDDIGSWYVWDSASGIVAGNDPFLLFNSASGQTTNTDYIDTAATGFEITSTVPAAINGSGGTFIFWAIA